MIFGNQQMIKGFVPSTKSHRWSEEEEEERGVMMMMMMRRTEREEEEKENKGNICFSWHGGLCAKML